MYDSNEWLKKSVDDEIYYVSKAQQAQEEYMEAEKAFKLADQRAQIVLMRIHKMLEARFYLDPRNTGKPFLWSEKTLSAHLLDSEDYRTVQQARVSKHVLQLAQEAYTSFSTQLFVIQQRIKLIEETQNRRSHLERTDETQVLMEEKKLQELVGDLEQKIFSWGERLQQADLDNKDTAKKTDLHGVVNNMVQQENYVDDYLADFCQRYGVLLAEQQATSVPEQETRQQIPIAN